MVDNVYLDAYGSVVNYIQKCKEGLINEGIVEDIEFRDIDGHAEDQTILNKDYLFIRGFSGNIDYQFREWIFQVGVSTFEDDNLFRHRQILNYVLQRFLPMDELPLYDSQKSDTEIGRLVVTDQTTVQPFSKFNTRGVQFLLVSVASTVTTREHQPLDHT